MVFPGLQTVCRQEPLWSASQFIYTLLSKQQVDLASFRMTVINNLSGNVCVFGKYQTFLLKYSHAPYILSLLGLPLSLFWTEGFLSYFKSALKTKWLSVHKNFSTFRSILIIHEKVWLQFIPKVFSWVDWVSTQCRPIPFTGVKGVSPTSKKKTSLHYNRPSTKLYTRHKAVRHVLFSWQSLNPDLSNRLTEGKA